MKFFYQIIIGLGIISMGWSQEANQPQPFLAALDVYQNIRDFCISTDGNEAFFSIQSPNGALSQIVSISRTKEQWSSPKLLPFCDEFVYFEPFLSIDQKRLYFVSNRPLSGKGAPKDFDIWYVERKERDQAWSEPINLGAPINTSEDEFYPSISNNGNLYFTMASKKGMGKDDIYKAVWNGSSYDSPTLLGNNINSEGYEFNAFISPDESFLIYTKYNAKDGLGSGDLYIAKQNEAGQWEKATNMGATINSKQMDYCPFYDVKTATLYFTSRRSNLKTKAFKNTAVFQQYIGTGANGNSKIYQAKWSKTIKN